MASRSLEEIQADIALDGLSSVLGRFNQGALSSFTHGSEASFNHVQKSLEELMSILGEAAALRQSIAKSVNSTQVPLNA